jgi:hypothetical protein
VVLSRLGQIVGSVSRATSVEAIPDRWIHLSTTGPAAFTDVHVLCLTNNTIATVNAGAASAQVRLDCMCSLTGGSRCVWLTVAARFKGDLEIAPWRDFALQARATTATTTLEPGPRGPVGYTVGDFHTDLSAPFPEAVGTQVVIGSDAETQFRLNSAGASRGAVLGTSRATEAVAGSGRNLVQSRFDRLGGIGSSYFLTVLAIVVPLALTAVLSAGRRPCRRHQNNTKGASK